MITLEHFRAIGNRSGSHGNADYGPPTNYRSELGDGS
jgi:hypothetical protein